MGEYSSSSREEDGDAAWKAAISSAAAGASSYINGLSAKQDGAEDSKQSKTQQLPKHYQVKAQKLLDDIIGKSLEMVSTPMDVPDDEAVVNEEEGVIRLFKNAPPGIVFDHVDEQPLRKRPRILPGNEINENLKRKIQSVAVDGNDIVSKARDQCQRALSRLEAKDAAAKEAAKKEEERVAQLKKVRGERWLPSLAREMQSKVIHR
ncbi:hypothetical protein M0R45_004684 [Rubus argutus]|uniref:Uncharacterized protein n=1 Tax=Rubus argutus TaxID=59490 RepID=A0AAW1YKG8_RUBAR